MIIEQLRDADKNKAAEFMKGIFSSEKMRKASYFDRYYWRWLYQDNPYGKAVTVVAKEEDDIIGQYANIPVNIKFNSTTLISSLTIDLMVDKPYRRQGLFKKMAQAANDRLLDAGIALSIAFPGRKESYSGFVDRLGWFRIGNLKILAKPVFPRPGIIKRSRDEIKIEKIESFGSEADILWNRLKPLVKIGAIRNSSYLNWRYFKNPKGDYEVFMAWRNNVPAGYCVLKTVKFSGIKVGIIVDIFCIDALDIFLSLIKRAEGYFLRRGAFVCIVLQNKVYEDFLKRSGFKVLPDRFSPKNYTLIARANVDAMDLASLMDLDKWFLGFGDWDLV